MTRCAKCNRPLTRPPLHGMGQVCARNALGVITKRNRAAQAPDEKQQPLFQEAA